MKNYHLRYHSGDAVVIIVLLSTLVGIAISFQSTKTMTTTTTTGFHSQRQQQQHHNSDDDNDVYIIFTLPRYYS